MARLPTYTATVTEKSRGDYVVRTNLPPDKLSDLSVQVFRRWLEFALGLTEMNGHKLKHPTGKYASSLTYRQTGRASVQVFANEQTAPHANAIETGHTAIDMKQHLDMGRVYPMHGFDRPYPSMGDYAGPSGKPIMWAYNRIQGFTGFARVGPSGWVIPPMPAYSPAKILSDLVANEIRGMKR